MLGPRMDYNSADKEGKCSTFGFPDNSVFIICLEIFSTSQRINLIPEFVSNILIKRIYIPTICTHPDGSTYRLSKIIYY